MCMREGLNLFVGISKARHRHISGVAMIWPLHFWDWILFATKSRAIFFLAKPIRHQLFYHTIANS
jgi:hypothetical protein